MHTWPSIASNKGGQVPPSSTAMLSLVAAVVLAAAAFFPPAADAVAAPAVGALEMPATKVMGMEMGRVTEPEVSSNQREVFGTVAETANFDLPRRSKIARSATVTCSPTK